MWNELYPDPPLKFPLIGICLDNIWIHAWNCMDTSLLTCIVSVHIFWVPWVLYSAEVHSDEHPPVYSRWSGWTWICISIMSRFPLNSPSTQEPAADSGFHGSLGWKIWHMEGHQLMWMWVCHLQCAWDWLDSFFWNVKPLRNKTNKKGKTTRPQNSRTCTQFLDTAEEPSTKQLRQSTSFVTTSRTSSLWIQLTFPTWMGHGCIHCLSQYGFANNPLVSICSRSLSYTILKSWNLLYVFFWSWITRVAEIRHPRSWI